MDVTIFLPDILAFTISFFIVLIVVPPIIRVARAKHLFDKPGNRKIHKSPIPPLGGIAVFLGFIFSLVFIPDGYNGFSLKFLFLGTVLMLFIGLKDDLVGISPRKKFVIQVVAAGLIIVGGNVQITNLHGLLGFYEIGNLAGILLSMFIILSVVNAFNLIDGIDGLASGLGMVASLSFGIWFFLAGFNQMAVISFGMLGSLAAFFLYNVFGRKNKLFLGDTGSLIVGFVLAALVIRFNEINIGNTLVFSMDSAPVVSFAIVIVPLIDVLRVMIIRMLKGSSPFAADNNHIHHKLLQLLPGSHLIVTIIIISGNLLLIALALLFNFLAFNISLQFVLLFVAGVLLSFVPSLVLLWRNSNVLESSKWTALQTWPD